jgi:PAS domain S-box-containing protein
MLWTILLLLNTVICSTIGAACYVNRRILAAIPLGVLFVALTIWSFGSVAEINSITKEGKEFWTSFQYVGIVLAPASWIALALQYDSPVRQLRYRTLALLLIEPVLAVAAQWSNGLHFLFYRSLTLVPSESLGTVLDVEYGPLFWAHAVYAYLAMMAGTILMIRLAWRSTSTQRPMLIVLVASTFIPWIGNAIYLLGWSAIDLTPLGFAAFGATAAWGVSRRHLLELVPIARTALVETIEDGVLVLDRYGRIADLNSAAIRIFGYPRERMLTERLEVLWPDFTAVAEQQHKEVCLPTDQRTLRWYDIRITPLHSPRGALNGRLIVLHDQTTRKQVEQELRTAKEASDSANRAKSAFLAHISHEFLTPLSAIIGYSELLQREHTLEQSAPLLQDLQRIELAGRSLQGMINEVLDYTQMEAGVIDLSVEQIDLSLLITHVSSMIAPLMANHGNRLVIEHDPSAGSLHSDRNKLQRILWHMLSNAAKFTHHGEVLLHVSRLSKLDSEGRAALSSCDYSGDPVVFLIRDNGAGMSPEEVENLAEPLTPAPNASVRTFRGIGIGFAIAERLCRRLGGTIRIQSQLGQGTSVRFIVPDQDHQGA